jgi:hypothetical protein
MMDKIFAKLIAKDEIADLIYRYPRGLDRLDRAILLSLGHADATVEFSTLFKGTWAGYVEWLMHAHKSMLFNNHRITNMLIDVEADRAVSESSSTATLIVARSDGNIESRLVHSRYLDQWRHENSRWWLMRRVTVRDYRSVTVMTAKELEAKVQYAHAGVLKDQDPSYELFAQLRQSAQ